MTSRRWLVCILFLFLWSAAAGRTAEGCPGERGQTPALAPPKDAEDYYKLAMRPDAPPWDEALAHLEAAVSMAPDNLQYGNAYRRRCVAAKAYDRSIRFFEHLIKTQDRPAVRLQLALAYVDKLPAPGIGGVLGQGALSSQSIRELTKLMEGPPHPYTWAGWYARGMNFLHWPKAMRRTPEAIADFKKLLALQEAQGQTARTYFVLTYVALGDAYTKNGQFQEARALWQKGIALFPGNPDLLKRLSLSSDAALTAFVQAERGLQAPIDTDLSILWK